MKSSPEQPFIIENTQGEESGPHSAVELRARGISPRSRLRFNDNEPRSLAELIDDDDGSAALEEGLEPEELEADPFSRLQMMGFTWVGMLLTVEGLWLITLALQSRSFAVWMSAAILVISITTGLFAVIARRPWGWRLATLLTLTMALRHLALALSSPSLGVVILCLSEVASTIFLILTRPRGPALDWPPQKRRLLLFYSIDPSAEAANRSSGRLGPGPREALFGLLIFFGVVTLGVWVYHALVVPEAASTLTFIPRGSGWSRRMMVTAIFLSMGSIALIFGKRTLSAELSGRWSSRRIGALATGARLFLLLSVLLYAGRRTFRIIETIESRFLMTSALDQSITGQIREAIVELLPRDEAIGSFSLSFSLWFCFIMVLLGPVTEELFFRGLLFSGLRRRTTFPVAALLSAALFALSHLPALSWTAATPLMLYEILAGGLLTAWAYERSGTLLAPICLHILWNISQEVSSLTLS